MQHSRDVFARYHLMPRRLIDVSERDTSITLFGRKQSAPFMIGPTRLNRALWPKGDIILAEAAEKGRHSLRALHRIQCVDGGGGRNFQNSISVPD